jgi:hypothetical protein
MNRKQRLVLLAVPLVWAAAVLFVIPAPQDATPSSGLDLLATSRVSDVVPAAFREGASQVVLDGEWDLAEAKGEIHSDQPDWAGAAWKRVKMPNTIQHALFEAGAAPNPWYGANWKELQWIADHDWYLRRRFRIPKEGPSGWTANCWAYTRGCSEGRRLILPLHPLRWSMNSSCV